MPPYFRFSQPQQVAERPSPERELTRGGMQMAKSVSDIGSLLNRADERRAQAAREAADRILKSRGLQAEIDRNKAWAEATGAQTEVSRLRADAQRAENESKAEARKRKADQEARRLTILTEFGKQLDNIGLKAMGKDERDKAFAKARAIASNVGAFAYPDDVSEILKNWQSDMSFEEMAKLKATTGNSGSGKEKFKVTSQGEAENLLGVIGGYYQHLGQLKSNRPGDAFGGSDPYGPDEKDLSNNIKYAEGLLTEYITKYGDKTGGLLKKLGQYRKTSIPSKY